jgi:hypothetical protein
LLDSNQRDHGREHPTAEYQVDHGMDQIPPSRNSAIFAWRLITAHYAIKLATSSEREMTIWALENLAFNLSGLVCIAIKAFDENNNEG